MSAMDLVRVPRTERAPFAAILRRVGLAAGLMVFVALVVRVGGDGYVDITGEPIGFVDALYYASVTVTTTGYGDITAVSEGARLATIILITPARVLFLILVVGTTVEVLTDQSRELLRKRRWRRTVHDHTIICGFGATGQSAAADLMSRGIEPGRIVAVDHAEDAIELAMRMGMVGVLGDATRNEVLDQASVANAQAVIVSPHRDDTAVLIALSVRQRNPRVHLVAAVREQENLHLLEQSGADEVIDATAAVGRMLGLGTKAPNAAGVLTDLLGAGDGLELVETSPDTSGTEPVPPSGATLVAVIRGGVRLPQHEVRAGSIHADDRLVVLRESPI